jgi:hypothetical protein
MGHLTQEDTFLLRTPNFSPKLVISIKFDLRNQNTSLLKTSNVGPKGVLDRKVLLGNGYTSVSQGFTLKGASLSKNSVVFWMQNRKCKKMYYLLKLEKPKSRKIESAEVDPAQKITVSKLKFP